MEKSEHNATIIKHKRLAAMDAIRLFGIQRARYFLARRYARGESRTHVLNMDTYKVIESIFVH